MFGVSGYLLLYLLKYLFDDFVVVLNFIQVPGHSADIVLQWQATQNVQVNAGIITAAISLVFSVWFQSGIFFHD